MKNKSEFEHFEEMAQAVISVPHSEIKAKLDSEKAAKKRNKTKKSSASREANGRA